MDARETRRASPPDANSPSVSVSDPEADADPASASEEPRDRKAAPSERAIDRTLEQSFPASDPPGWTLGVDYPARRRADDPTEE